jgi:hypothetical protein
MLLKTFASFGFSSFPRFLTRTTIIIVLPFANTVVLLERLKTAFCAVLSPQFAAVYSYSLNKVRKSPNLYDWLLGVEQELLGILWSYLTFTNKSMNSLLGSVAFAQLVPVFFIGD